MPLSPYYNPIVTFQNSAKNIAPITATTPPLICKCEAAPGNGTIVAELVGVADVALEVEVPFPVTLRFRHICLTRVPNAVFAHQYLFDINSERKEAHFVNQKMNKSKSSAGTAQRWTVIGSYVRSDMHNRFLRSLRRQLRLCHRGTEGCQRFEVLTRIEEGVQRTRGAVPPAESLFLGRDFGLILSRWLKEHRGVTRDAC